MYLTNQIIPEGYTKAMVNYDIDDTGSCIRPRQGRERVQIINYESEVLGPVSLTDYIYAYNREGTEVEDIKDIVMSYGLYTKMKDLVDSDTLSYSKPIYVSAMQEHRDSNDYYRDDYDQWQLRQAGPVEDLEQKEFWALYYDKASEEFKKIVNEGVGYVSARTVENAYAFDKPINKAIGRPIGAVLNNELIAFAGGIFQYNNFPLVPERNELINFGTPELAKLKLTNRGDSVVINRAPIEARVLNPAEASTSGFNMLSGEPYTLSDEIGGAVAILGMLTYDYRDPSKVLFTTKLGEAFNLRVYYQYPAPNEVIKYKVEILDMTNSNSAWETLVDFTESFEAGTAFNYVMTPKYASTVVRVTFRLGDDSATDYPFTKLINSTDNSYSSLEGKTFDLSTGKGLISWLGCIGVYGVDSAQSTIFFSDVEDPGYFPFPYNVLEFDNEILAVHNYLDHLIVVTVDSIWLVTAGTTIATSIQKRILTNIHIPEIDALNLVVLKDQIFFKTDTQFYVLKPNKYTSDATDLKNYVNSTAIANYTAHFTEETVRLLNKVYPTVWQAYTEERRKQIRFEDFDVLDVRSVVRDSEVHYIYTIVPKLTDNIVLEKLNLHLVYNTLSRSWRIYFTAIGNNSVAYNPVLYKNKQSGVYHEFLPYAHDGVSTIVVAKQTYNVVTDTIPDTNITSHYNNYPYIDTGNLAIDDSCTKRFREVQFNIMNNEKAQLQFYTDFAIDGQEMVHATNYELNHITDINDPEYGKLYVTPIEQVNVTVPGSSALDYWVLDSSKFPDLNVATVRLQLQGRGRRGALQLLNTSLQRYELSDINWVYRNMSAR